jgi:hypothetical protein
MKMIQRSLTSTLMLVIIHCGSLLAQQTNKAITQKDKIVIVDKAIQLLYSNYVYVDRVKGLEIALHSNLNHNEYQKQTTLFEFLEVLNRDLEALGNDHHLDIFYGPDRVKKIRAENEPGNTISKEGDAAFKTMLQYENYGIKKIERLDGNIGYLKFNHFPELQYGKEALISAMNLVRNSSALVVDLQQNGGGAEETVRFLSSYFLSDTTFLGAFKRRVEGEVIKSYPLKDAAIHPVDRAVQVYILVSKKTSSAAEAFTHYLQQQGRAIVVGENTHGERNPGLLFPINDELYMMIPTAAAYDIQSGQYITETSVIPDIVSAMPLPTALLQICRYLGKKVPPGGQSWIYTWQIPALENELNPAHLSNGVINALVGNYDKDRKIITEGGSVFYINSAGQKARLLYYGNGIFQHEEKKSLRLVMPFTDKPVPEFTWEWDDGGIEKVKRLEK